MSRRVSSSRKGAYYLGGALTVVGFVLFFSIFVTGMMDSGSGSPIGLRAVLGMGMMITGAFVRSIGARGLAGSGVVLDPEQARRDLEPYSRMAGGMVKDALEEADVDLGQRSEAVVMLKCSACGHLNEEDSKFCQECGRPL